jgi:predicted aspartyl protease
MPLRTSVAARHCDSRTGREDRSLWSTVLIGSNGLRWFCGLLLLLSILTPEAPAKSSDALQKISFKLYRNHLVITLGSLAGSGKRKLLIDTGTNVSMVDIATAHELGLRPAMNGTLKAIDGIVQASYSILPSIDLGPIHGESLPVAVVDLSWLYDQAKIRVDAVVGVDVLGRSSFEIDYQSKVIKFGAIRIPKSAMLAEEVDRLLTVPVRLNGGPAQLLVDTGGSALVLFTSELPRSTTWKTLGTTRLSNSAGYATVSEVQVRELQIGDTNLNGSKALIAGTPACCHLQGILGISALHFNRVSFDFKHHMVGFEFRNIPELPSDDPFPRLPCCADMPRQPRSVSGRP